jgi:hypothetical protein
MTTEMSTFTYLKSVRYLPYYPLKTGAEIYSAARAAAIKADREAYRQERA